MEVHRVLSPSEEEQGEHYWQDIEQNVFEGIQYIHRDSRFIGRSRARSTRSRQIDPISRSAAERPMRSQTTVQPHRVSGSQGHRYRGRRHHRSPTRQPVADVADSPDVIHEEDIGDRDRGDRDIGGEDECDRDIGAEDIGGTEFETAAQQQVIFSCNEGILRLYYKLLKLTPCTT